MVKPVSRPPTGYTKKRSALNVAEIVKALFAVLLLGLAIGIANFTGRSLADKQGAQPTPASAVVFSSE